MLVCAEIIHFNQLIFFSSAVLKLLRCVLCSAILDLKLSGFVRFSVRIV